MHTARIIQDHIPLDIEYEMHDSGIEVLEINHQGESIYDLIAAPTNADPLMVAIEIKTVQAWAQEELNALAEDGGRTRHRTHWQIMAIAEQRIRQIRDAAKAEKREGE